MYEQLKSSGKSGSGEMYCLTVSNGEFEKGLWLPHERFSGFSVDLLGMFGNIFF